MKIQITWSDRLYRSAIFHSRRQAHGQNCTDRDYPLGDRVAQGGKREAQRLQFERRLRFFDPEVGMANSSWELTVGSSSKEKPTVTRALTLDTRSRRHCGEVSLVLPYYKP